ncbi:hypothetical protein Y032_0286g1420 [Ancylostoma ceylanicum]|uniref:Uncharacterized protein n=1 Tax=Ancylostoma ceylanicum TaxID=53326 RepID=A0A016S6N6_9BILA|nr:hypothetical protein Y032_0286g1420 [Ancylostoma ceylanicum]
MEYIVPLHHLLSAGFAVGERTDAGQTAFAVFMTYMVSVRGLVTWLNNVMMRDTGCRNWTKWMQNGCKQLERQKQTKIPSCKRTKKMFPASRHFLSCFPGTT